MAGLGFDFYLLIIDSNYYLSFGLCSLSRFIFMEE